MGENLTVDEYKANILSISSKIHKFILIPLAFMIALVGVVTILTQLYALISVMPTVDTSNAEAIITTTLKKGIIGVLISVAGVIFYFLSLRVLFLISATLSVIYERKHSTEPQ